MKKYLISILFIVIMLLTYTACNNNNNGGGSNLGDIDTEVIVGFESYEQVQDFYWSNRFGRAVLNHEKDFIKSGNSSLKIEPYGDFEKNVMPTITMNMASSYINKNDFSGFEYVSLDVFNASNRVVPINMYLETEEADGTILNVPAIAKNLPANSWSKLIYDFSDGAIAKGHNLTDITAIKLQFPNFRKSAEEYDPDTVYVDNLIGKKTSNSNANYIKTYAQNELFFLEKLSDLYLLAASDGLIVSAESRTFYVKAGTFSIATKGTGTIALKKSIIDTSKLTTAQTISVDVCNASDGNRFYLEIIFDSNNKVTKEVFGYRDVWQTITILLSDLNGKNFANLKQINLITMSEAAYFDNLRVS